MQFMRPVRSLRPIRSAKLRITWSTWLCCFALSALASGPPVPPLPQANPPVAEAVAEPVAEAAVAPATEVFAPLGVTGPFPGARLGRKNASSEYWDVTAVFDQGHRIFARFSISNEGPGDRTAYALGQILFPDGTVVPFQNGRLEGDWKLSDDRLRVKIGSSVLDWHGPPYHFEVDKNKKRIKFYLDFESTGAARSWKSAPKGYHLDLLTLGAKAHGTVWVGGVVEEPVVLSGRITVTHAWMDDSETELLLRRLEPHGVTSKDGRSHVYAIHTLDEKKSRASSWLVARNGSRWRETEGFSVSENGKHAASKKGYRIPRVLDLAGSDVRGRVDIGPELLRHDPLAVAPRVFRWLLSSKPSHVWLRSRYALEWQGDEEPRIFEGEGVSSVYFLNAKK